MTAKQQPPAPEPVIDLIRALALYVERYHGNKRQYEREQARS